MSRPAAIAKRARSDEQKRLRRETILAAADELFAAVGFEAFSMAELARRAGVVKGTLYLYFETREEVLLALHCEKLNAWRVGLEDMLRKAPDDESFLAAFYDSAYAVPGLLNLMSRLDSVIEHNVSLETLIDAKRFMAAEVAELAGSVARQLGLSPEQSQEALAACAALLLGASQVDSGPTLDEDALPPEVQRFMQAFASRDLFLTNARRILGGIRSESAQTTTQANPRRGTTP